MVLRGPDRYRADAVADDEEGNLGSHEMLFDHEPAARCAESLFGHRRGDRSLGVLAVCRDNDTFTCG